MLLYSGFSIVSSNEAKDLLLMNCIAGFKVAPEKLHYINSSKKAQD